MKTYYCYIPIASKLFLKNYVDNFKMQTGRSVILTPAKYQTINSGLQTAQNTEIAEQTNLLGFCLTADSTDINDTILNLIVSIGGQNFDNNQDYINFIETL